MYLFTAIKTLTKTEVGTRDWGIVIGLTMFLFKEIGLLDFGLEKQMNALRGT